MANLPIKVDLSVFQTITALFQRPTIQVRTNFFRLMAISQDVGLGLRDSVINILKTEKNSTMKRVLQDIIESLSEWASFADAMSLHPLVFAANEVELVRASESMWNLPAIMREIAIEMENLQKIYQRIRSAITYPAVLAFFSVVAVIILLVYVIPTIISLFPNTESLPWITLFMIWVSDFVSTSWYVIIITIIALIIGFQFAYKRFLPFKKVVDLLMLNFPVLWEVTKSFYMYRFCKLLWDFTRAWVPTVKAFSQMKNIFSNYYYKKKTYEILKDMQSWFSLWDSVEWSSLFDPLLIQVIMVWENTWNLGDVLLSMSTFYKEKFRITIDILMGFLEPLLMVIIATVIWTIVASVFLPIADLVNVIGQ